MVDPISDASQGAQEAQSPSFSIERIYIKDLSLENPGSPQSFQLTEQPHVEVGMRTRGEQIGPDVYEFVLTITVTATVAGKTLFLVETSQAGIFAISGFTPEQLGPVMAINCPQVLFPFARETISNATVRAGFPPINLAPINFDTLYQEQLAQQQVPAVTN
ncbi:MAG: protein-export chaperone SecB [Betaproteobacteria bacterium]